MRQEQTAGGAAEEGREEEAVVRVRSNVGTKRVRVRLSSDGISALSTAYAHAVLQPRDGGEADRETHARAHAEECVFSRAMHETEAGARSLREEEEEEEEEAKVEARGAGGELPLRALGVRHGELLWLWGRIDADGHYHPPQGFRGGRRQSREEEDTAGSTGEAAVDTGTGAQSETRQPSVEGADAGEDVAAVEYDEEVEDEEAKRRLREQMEADEALAVRLAAGVGVDPMDGLAASQGGELGAGPGLAPGPDSPNVRAPDPATMDRLVGGGSGDRHDVGRYGVIDDNVERYAALYEERERRDRATRRAGAGRYRTTRSGNVVRRRRSAGGAGQRGGDRHGETPDDAEAAEGGQEEQGGEEADDPLADYIPDALDADLVAAAREAGVPEWELYAQHYAEADAKLAERMQADEGERLASASVIAARRLAERDMKRMRDLGLVRARAAQLEHGARRSGRTTTYSSVVRAGAADSAAERASARRRERIGLASVAAEPTPAEAADRDADAASASESIRKATGRTGRAGGSGDGGGRGTSNRPSRARTRATARASALSTASRDTEDLALSGSGTAGRGVAPGQHTRSSVEQSARRTSARSRSRGSPPQSQGKSPDVENIEQPARRVASAAATADAGAPRRPRARPSRQAPTPANDLFRWEPTTTPAARSTRPNARDPTSRALGSEAAGGAGTDAGIGSESAKKGTASTPATSAAAAAVADLPRTGRHRAAAATAAPTRRLPRHEQRTRGGHHNASTASSSRSTGARASAAPASTSTRSVDSQAPQPSRGARSRRRHELGADGATAADVISAATQSRTRAGRSSSGRGPVARTGAGVERPNQEQLVELGREVERIGRVARASQPQPRPTAVGNTSEERVRDRGPSPIHDAAIEEDPDLALAMALSMSDQQDQQRRQQQEQPQEGSQEPRSSSSSSLSAGTLSSAAATPPVDPLATAARISWSPVSSPVPAPRPAQPAPAAAVAATSGEDPFSALRALEGGRLEMGTSDREQLLDWMLGDDSPPTAATAATIAAASRPAGRHRATARPDGGASSSAMMPTTASAATERSTRRERTRQTHPVDAHDTVDADAELARALAASMAEF